MKRLVQIILLACVSALVHCQPDPKISVSGADLTGSNVCSHTITEPKTTMVEQKVPYTYRTREWCSEPPTFRCWKSIDTFKIEFVPVTSNETRVDIRCCTGYKRVDNHCELCMQGDTAECTFVGHLKQEESASQQKETITIAVPVAIILFLLLLSLMLCLVFHYRRKYHNARDPPLPEVRYGFSEDMPVDKTKFDNPMYSNVPQRGQVLVNYLEGGKMGTNCYESSSVSTDSGAYDKLRESIYQTMDESEHYATPKGKELCTDGDSVHFSKKQLE